jgi:pimeloyl-ACP methyl ester carboxylesterase
MKRWLLDKDEPVPAVEFPTLPPSELLCTATGEVLTAFPNERSVFDLNAALETELQQNRKQAQEAQTPDELRSQIRQMLGVPVASELQSPDFEDIGRLARDGYHLDKLVLRRSAGVPLPGLTFHPPAPQDAAYLYLHDGGKVGDSHKDGPVEKLVASGHAVVTIDLSGQGETATGKRDELLSDWKTYYLSYLLGRPLLGIRVEDTLAAGDFVAHYQKDAGDSRQVHLVGVGQAGIIALHAAALNPELFTTVTVTGALHDWSSLTGQDTPVGQADSVVHGALQVYDLPDLVRLIGIEKVNFED